MVQKFFFAILLLTWSLWVTAIEDDDMAPFTQPFTQATSPATSLSKVVPAGGTNELVGGLIPDAQSLARGGVLSKRGNMDQVDGESQAKAAQGPTKVSLIDLRRRMAARALQRRSSGKMSMMSGTELMDRARQGVVVDPQEKSNAMANVRRRRA